MANTIGTFGTYTPAEKTNPYIPTMRAFKDATDKDENASWTVELEAARETVERVLISEAAHTVGKTARLRNRDDSKRTVVGNREKSGNPIYAGIVTLTFTLSEKHKPRRGK